MSLSSEHLEDLRKSGLTDETISGAGIHAVPPSKINEIFGWKIPIISLLAIPYPGTDFIRYKLFPPYKKNGEEKPMRYFQPQGSGVHLYIPSGFDISAPVIRITEGEKKGLKGTQEGLNVIGLSGIWSFTEKDDNGSPQMIDALKQISWSGKTVEIIPDADFQTN